MWMSKNQQITIFLKSTFRSTFLIFCWISPYESNFWDLKPKKDCAWAHKTSLFLWARKNSKRRYKIISDCAMVMSPWKHVCDSVKHANSSMLRSKIEIFKLKIEKIVHKICWKNLTATWMIKSRNTKNILRVKVKITVKMKTIQISNIKPDKKLTYLFSDRILRWAKWWQ